MSDGRIRHRQGAVRIVDGVPYANRQSTLSLLPGAAVGRWLASRETDLRGTLLDLGAGNQPFRSWYGSRVTRVVAVDVAPAAGLDVLTLAAPLPFRDAVFDTILCTSVLEHVDNPECAVDEMSRVLRPGGRLLITVPFLYPTHEAPYDYWRTTHHGLASVLRRHGFLVDDLSAQGGPFLLMGHFGILGVVGALRVLSRALGPLGRLFDNRLLAALIAAPQELIRVRVSTRLSALSKAASLGYMAAARKPG
ncbi:MAG: class I SAM-dependent methyltransferase [Actinomycetota bacterium]